MTIEPARSELRINNEAEFLIKKHPASINITHVQHLNCCIPKGEVGINIYPVFGVF